MDTITQHVAQVGSPYTRGAGWAALVENQTSFTMIDPCYGWRVVGRDETGTPAYTPLFESLLETILAKEKPVRWIVLTHAHVDRLENLRFINKSFEGYRGRPPRAFFDYQLIVQENSPLRRRVGRRVEGDVEWEIDGRPYLFLSTPGHSNLFDDLSIYIPEDRVLFCGDLCQPQGPSFDRVDSVTPFQSFEDGDLAMDSIRRLLEIDFLFLKSASGHTYESEEGRNALQVTLQVLERLDELAHRLVRENPRASVDELCEWIYDTLCYDRGFPPDRAYWRKTARTVEGKTEYEVYDKPEIEFFVRKYM